MTFPEHSHVTIIFQKFSNRFCKILAQFYLFGRELRNKSFVFPFNFSGKTISKDISMSPFLEGSLDNGRPFPAIRFTVDGFTISSNKLTTNRSPFSVGTSTLVPHNAWKNKRIYQLMVSLNTKLRELMVFTDILKLLLSTCNLLIIYNRHIF